MAPRKTDRGKTVFSTATLIASYRCLDQDAGTEGLNWDEREHYNHYDRDTDAGRIIQRFTGALQIFSDHQKTEHGPVKVFTMPRPYPPEPKYVTDREHMRRLHAAAMMAKCETNPRNLFPHPWDAWR